jgi:hypothetical protein
LVFSSSYRAEGSSPVVVGDESYCYLELLPIKEESWSTTFLPLDSSLARSSSTVSSFYVEDCFFFLALPPSLSSSMSIIMWPS